MLEANKKQVHLKSYSLEIRIDDSANQILKNKEKDKQDSWEANENLWKKEERVYKVKNRGREPTEWLLLTLDLKICNWLHH